MELLQTITATLNKEEYCPAHVNKCELLYDADEIRTLLLLRLDGLSSSDKAFFDVCCYGSDGNKLSILTNVPYSNGGMYVHLPSLMTVKAAVILRTVERDGIKWNSDAEFPYSLSASEESKEATAPESITETDNTNSDISDDTAEKPVSDNTMEFDSSAVAKSIVPEEKNVRLSKTERRAKRKERAAAEEEIRQMIKHDPHERRKRIIIRILILLIIVGAIFGGRYAITYKMESDKAYTKAMSLYNKGDFSGNYGEVVAALEEARKYVYLGEKDDELTWCLATAYTKQNEFFSAAVRFKELGSYKESRKNYRNIIHSYSGIVSAGDNHTVILSDNGTVVAFGNNNKFQCETTSWTDIKRVSAGKEHTLALTKNGQVLATGDNSFNQCDVSEWNNIIDISCGARHSVGVENTGRVVAVGDNSFEQCNVDTWSGIVAVSAGVEHTVGLTVDGKVVACGNNSAGACNVSEWQDIVAVAAGHGFTAGLKYDGTVVITGDDSNNISDAADAKDALSIDAGSNHLLVLQADGTVAAYGSNKNNQTATNSWESIVAVSGGTRHSVGVCSDGTLYATGDNEENQAAITTIAGVGLPKGTVTTYKNNAQN